MFITYNERSQKHQGRCKYVYVVVNHMASQLYNILTTLLICVKKLNSANNAWKRKALLKAKTSGFHFESCLL